MEIAVVGSEEFVVGFRLAGIKKVVGVPPEKLQEAILELMERMNQRRGAKSARLSMISLTVVLMRLRFSSSRVPRAKSRSASCKPLRETSSR